MPNEREQASSVFHVPTAIRPYNRNKFVISWGILLPVKQTGWNITVLGGNNSKQTNKLVAYQYSKKSSWVNSRSIEENESTAAASTTFNCYLMVYLSGD